MKPGDLILIQQRGNFFSSLIRFGQRLRFRGDDRKYAWCNHVAIVVNSSHIVEALVRGVSEDSLSHYLNNPKRYVFRFVDTGLSDTDRKEAVDYALAHVGDLYDWPAILGLGLTCLTGRKFSLLRFPGTFVCSEIASDTVCFPAFERGVYDCPSLPLSGVVTDLFHPKGSAPMPADIAKHYGVSV